MPIVLLLLLPILEVYVFIEAIDEFGFWMMMAEVIFTAWLGFTILRYRSLIIASAIQKTLSGQNNPDVVLVNSLLVFLGAVLLIVPGVITDILGLLCVLPTRHFVAQLLKHRLSSMVKNGRFRSVYMGSAAKDSAFASDFSGYANMEDMGMGSVERDFRDVTPSEGRGGASASAEPSLLDRTQDTQSGGPKK